MQHVVTKKTPLAKEGYTNQKHEVFPFIIQSSVFNLQFSVTKKPSPRGEGVDQRETDEGSAFPIDVGLCGAVSQPRNMEEQYTLC